jgi:sulfur carrier protein
VSGALIEVNGQSRPLTCPDLADLLAELGYDSGTAGIAVAVNGEVVPRASWARHALRAGDAVEIVGAVQGG